MEENNRSALTSKELHNLCAAIDGLQNRMGGEGHRSKLKFMPSENEATEVKMRYSGHSGQAGRSGHAGGKHQSQTMKVYSDHYTFTCLACNQFAFKSPHMYNVNRGNCTVVADVGMYTRCATWRDDYSKPSDVKTGLHTNRQRTTATLHDDDWVYNRKIACACCGRHWGLLGERYGLIIPFMKLTSYRVHAPDGRIKTYKRYCDLPMKFQRLNERAFYEHTNDLYYKDCMDMKGTLTSEGGILQTEFAHLYVPPGAIIGVKSHIQCDTNGFSSYLDEFVDNDEQVITPSFGTDLQCVTNDNEIGKDKYCVMNRFVKHVCIRLAHIAHDPKNIKVCVNTHRNEFQYRGIKRVDMSNEIVADLEDLQDGVADHYIDISTQTMNCQDFYKSFNSDQDIAPLHPNEIVEWHPDGCFTIFDLSKSAIKYLQKDAVSQFIYNMTMTDFKHLKNKYKRTVDQPSINSMEDHLSHADDDYFCADDKYVYIFTRHLAGCYTCTETHRMTSTPTQITLLVYASIYQGYVDAVIYVYDPKEVHPQYLKSLNRYQHDHYRSLLVTHSITYTNNLDMDDMLEININNISELQQHVHTIDVFNTSTMQYETVSELFSIQQRRQHPSSCIAFPQILGCYQFQAISQHVKNLKAEFRVSMKTSKKSTTTVAVNSTDKNTASYHDIAVNFDLSTDDSFGDGLLFDDNNTPQEVPKGFL